MLFLDYSSSIYRAHNQRKEDLVVSNCRIEGRKEATLQRAKYYKGLKPMATDSPAAYHPSSRVHAPADRNHVLEKLRLDQSESMQWAFAKSKLEQVNKSQQKDAFHQIHSVWSNFEKEKETVSSLERNLKMYSLRKKIIDLLEVTKSCSAGVGNCKLSINFLKNHELLVRCINEITATITLNGLSATHAGKALHLFNEIAVRLTSMNASTAAQNMNLEYIQEHIRALSNLC